MMLEIRKQDLIGKGAHRECYRHPGNQHLCVKVITNGSHRSVEIKREKKYYRHLEKRNISWDMIPRYYGDVETNLGPGSVFDLITDQDGTVSKSLEYYLSSNEEMEKYGDNLFKSLYLLKEYLLKNGIVTMNIKPYNILCQKNESGNFRSFLIDNIYNSELIPISTYSHYFAKHKILRKWQRFENIILNTFKNNNALRHKLAGSMQG
jgi:hypothetical protein